MHELILFSYVKLVYLVDKFGFSVIQIHFKVYLFLKGRNVPMFSKQVILYKYSMHVHDMKHLTNGHLEWSLYILHPMIKNNQYEKLVKCSWRLKVSCGDYL